MNFLNRNLYLLFACQTIFVSGSILLVTVGGIVGHAIAPDEGFATLPVALMVIGTAAATIPAAWMMQRKGRRFGFIFAAVLGAFGATLATYALHGEYFGLFCAATVPVGASLGFSQQFRFAAAGKRSNPPGQSRGVVYFAWVDRRCFFGAGVSDTFRRHES